MFQAILNSKPQKYTLRESGAGFTLLEIALTITIISLLALFVLVAINPAKKIGEARDSRRLNDADLIKQAISEYVLKNQSWPAEIAALATNTPYVIIPAGSDPVTNVDCHNLLGTVANSVALDLVPDYLPTIPTDPENNYYYLYRRDNYVEVGPCTTYASSYNISDGLIALWHFDESTWNNVANEVIDSVGSYHGRSSSNTYASTTLDSKWGSKGGSFNNGKVTVAGTAAINPPNFSIGYWFKNRGNHIAGSVPRITSRLNRFETAVANTYGAADDKSVYVYYGAWFDTAYDAEPGEWHYYVWTYNGSAVKLYVDGVEEYSHNVTVNIVVTDGFYVGNTSSGNEGVFGMIDEVSLWNRAISQAEATYIYNLQR